MPESESPASVRDEANVTGLKKTRQTRSTLGEIRRYTVRWWEMREVVSIVPEVRSKRVLIVDDEPALLRAVSRILLTNGWEATTCLSGASAAELILKEQFTVVLSDVDMPGLSGIELLKLLRERAVDVPVILMTGAPMLESAVQAVEYGAFKYLTKPVRMKELLDTVERAARARSAVSRRAAALDSNPVSSGVESVRPVDSDRRASIVPGGILAERYELVQMFAEGGMGEVWEAKHLLTRRRVAVKVLQHQLNALPDMRNRLLREARAATSVEHPNVVNVYDVFELEDGSPVMVMAFLSGETLSCRLEREGRLELPDAADVLLPVMSAVGFAHSRGVVHRDLKPENVFLSSDGGIKVLDFGIAKLINPDEQDAGSLTRTGMVIGTPGYMAPEQCFGDGDIDHQADVWAIGAIAYEALSGLPAVSASTFGQALKQFANKTTVPISTRVPDLPVEIASLVDRMLAVDRQERPSDLREAYREFARHARVSAPEFGAPVPRVSELPEAPAVSGTMPIAKASASRASIEDAVAIKIARG